MVTANKRRSVKNLELPVWFAIVQTLVMIGFTILILI